MTPVLEQVVARVLNVPPATVTDALEFNGVPEWDSLNHVNLMMELEQAYDVAIGDDDMVELTSVAAIRAFVTRNSHAAGAGGS